MFRSTRFVTIFASKGKNCDKTLFSSLINHGLKPVANDI